MESAFRQSLKYTIPMGLGIACDPDTEGYYNLNSNVDIDYTTIAYGLFGWTFLENLATSTPPDVFSHDWLESTITDIPEGAQFLTLTNNTRNFKFSSVSKSGPIYYSTIEFFNSVGASIEVYPLNDFLSTGYIADSIDIDLSTLEFYNTFDSFRITEVYTNITPTVMFSVHNTINYNFDDVIMPIVNFWVDDSIDFYRLSPLGAYVPYSVASPVKEGYDFIDWVYHDNTPYRYPDPISETYFINGQVNLYATFREIPTDFVGPVQDLTANEGSKFTSAMTSLGFNDPIERTIVFGFVVILTSLLLLFKGVSNFAILIVVTCELLFFMYLGVLPLFTSIIIGLVLLLIGFKTMGGE